MPAKTRRDWGTAAVLLVDLAATLGISTWGVLYLRTDLKYLLVIAAISLGLAFLIWMLLRAGATPSARPDESR